MKLSTFWSPITSITPFTYRDNWTYLEKLEYLFTRLNEITESFNALTSQVENSIKQIDELLDAFKGDFTEKLNALENKHDEDILKLRKELLQAIADSQKGGVVFNPTNGRRDESVEKVINDVYDNVRVHAHFVENMENGDTATVIDERALSGQRFDLDPESETNHATNEVRNV